MNPPKSTNPPNSMNPAQKHEPRPKSMSAGQARARACANIAMAKYWGKSDADLNLPAVPSLSVTLEPLSTETSVVFDPSADADVFSLDGQTAPPAERARVVAVLDRVRHQAGIGLRARVESVNHFPTGAGLASSASGFAALSAAATAAAGLSLSAAALSALARSASASAARSVFGGFVKLPAGRPGQGDLAAQPLLPASHWDLSVVVAITARGRKAIGSRTAMNLSRDTSRYYPAWVEGAEASCKRVAEALAARDFRALAAAVEESSLAMHALAMTSSPPVLYWQPGSVAALHAVRRLRDAGVPVCATMDAGPHVKCICERDARDRVRRALSETPGVHETLVAVPGPGVRVTLGAP